MSEMVAALTLQSCAPMCGLGTGRRTRFLGRSWRFDPVPRMSGYRAEAGVRNWRGAGVRSWRSTLGQPAR